MDSVFGDWYEDRGGFVSRSADGSRVESKDHGRVFDASRAMRSGSVGPTRVGSEGGGGLDAGGQDEKIVSLAWGAELGGRAGGNGGVDDDGGEEAVNRIRPCRQKRGPEIRAGDTGARTEVGAGPTSRETGAGQRA